jgi:hypothetical protein
MSAFLCSLSRYMYLQELGFPLSPLLAERLPNRVSFESLMVLKLGEFPTCVCSK